MRILGLLGAARQRADRVLPSLALIEPPGIHHQPVHLDRAPGTGYLGELHPGAAEREARFAPDGPAGQHGDAGQGRRVLLGRHPAERAVRQAERAA
jgi:hypothetical protein